MCTFSKKGFLKMVNELIKQTKNRKQSWRECIFHPLFFSKYHTEYKDEEIQIARSLFLGFFIRILSVDYFCPATEDGKRLLRELYNLAKTSNKEYSRLSHEEDLKTKRKILAKLAQ
ncbi:MAG: hypothetical protein PHT40_02245 [Patescibacteria group bacterium]|nr:hypothetical protein [Patescibacteria group bacterium]